MSAGTLRSAPIVHQEHAALDAQSAPTALDCFDVALPSARRIGLGIAEAGEVGRDRIPTRILERREGAAPHVGGLRVAVQEQRDRIPLESALAVGESASVFTRAA
jgi:hypothetical protein